MLLPQHRGIGELTAPPFVCSLHASGKWTHRTKRVSRNVSASGCLQMQTSHARGQCWRFHVRAWLATGCAQACTQVETGAMEPGKSQEGGENVGASMFITLPKTVVHGTPQQHFFSVDQTHSLSSRHRKNPPRLHLALGGSRGDERRQIQCSPRGKSEPASQTGRRVCRLDC